MTAAHRARGLSPDEEAFVQDEGRLLAAIDATGCPPPALLRAAAVDALPPDMAAPVHAHVRACGICRQLTADLLDVDAELDMLEDARIRRRVSGARRTPVWRAVAVAATLVIAAGGAVLASRASNPGVIPTLSSPAAARPAFPTRSILAADKLEPRVDAGMLVWRGGSDHFTLDLAAALKPYAENNFKAASAALEKLQARYPEHAEPSLYLGIARLLMDRPVEAEQALRRAAAIDGPLNGDARWYLAVAQYQNGRRSDARQLFAQICRDNTARSAEACLAQDQAIAAGDSK